MAFSLVSTVRLGSSTLGGRHSNYVQLKWSAKQERSFTSDRRVEHVVSQSGEDKGMWSYH